MAISIPSIEGPVEKRMKHVKHIIVVLAGKGGVGKSSISTQLALSLHSLPSSPSHAGPNGRPRVGILDIDLTGPSVPRMLGLDGRAVHQSTEGWVPVYADGAEKRLACMSVGFLLKKRGDSVVWRGPKKNAMIRQFLTDVRWGELDYLVIDTPPGTSDEHLSLLEHLAPIHDRLSSVIVTTPQAVALVDSLKCLSFTRATNLPVLGLIENMSGYVCPCCGEISNVFSTGGGEAMAAKEGLKFLGALPVDTQLVELLDGEAIAEKEKEKGASNSTGNDEAVAVGTVEEAEAKKEEHTFELLERYQRTPTYNLFRGMSESILARLQELSSPPVQAAV